MTDDLAEAKRHIRALIDLDDDQRYAEEPSDAYLDAMAFLSRLDAEGQTVEGGASRPVVVTDEMALQGAWGPINEFAQRVGLQPFDPRMAPDINEIERVRLILSAALNMATNGAPKEKAGS